MRLRIFAQVAAALVQRAGAGGTSSVAFAGGTISATGGAAQ
jgi:hypothetical protein